MSRLINETGIKKIVATILEQTDGNEITMSADKFTRLLDVVNYNMDVLSKSKLFRGKKINIEGNLNLNDSRITSMGNIVNVYGNLDINRSNIPNVDGVNITGRLSYYNSKMARIEEAKIRAEKLEEGNERRETGEWDLDNENIDDEGLEANALLLYFESEGYRIRTPEDSQRLSALKDDLERLKAEETEKLDNGEDITDLTADIESIEEEITELEESFDVYNIIPENSTHYGLNTFRIYGTSISESNLYAVGTYDDAYDAAVNSTEDLIRDDASNVASWVINDAIDIDEVVDYFEEIYSSDIEDSPESYFSRSDFEYSDEDQEKIEELEQKIEELEEIMSELDSDSEEYTVLEEELSELRDELDEIEPTITEEMKEEKLDDLLSDVRRDPIGSLESLGFEPTRFIDYKKAAETVVDTDGIGHILSTYDGSEEQVDVGNNTYLIFRID